MRKSVLLMVILLCNPLIAMNQEKNDHFKKVSLDVVGHILSFAMQETGAHREASIELYSAVHARNVRNFLLTCRRYYNNEGLVAQLLEYMRVDQNQKFHIYPIYGKNPDKDTKEQFHIYGSLYLRTITATRVLKLKLADPKYMVAAGYVLRDLSAGGDPCERTKDLVSIKRIMTKLLAAGVPIDIASKGEGYTALMTACLKRKNDIRDFLIQKGANQGLLDANGRNLDYYKRRYAN